MKNLFSFLTAAALCATGFAQNGMSTSSLQAYYGFCGNANDLSNNGRNGTLQGGATYGDNQAGSPQKALSVSNINDFADLPDGNYFSGGAFTISSWVKVNAIVNDAGYFGFSDGSGSIPNRIDGGLSYGSLNHPYLSIGTSTYTDYPNGTTLPVGQWAHLAWVLDDAGTLKCYINKVVAFEKTGVSFPSNVIRTNCFIGKSSYPIGLNGSVDEFSIHSKAFSQAQIDSLYNLNQCSVAGGVVALQAYYGFCGNVTDLSKKGFDGTLQGGATYGDSRTGTPQQALSVSNINDFADLPDGNYLSGSAFTVSSWVKVNAIVNDAGYFGFSDGIGSIPNRVDGGLSYGSLNHPYLSIGTSTYTDYPSGTTLPVGQWAHLAWVLDDAGTLKCYINKVMAFEKTGVSFPSNVIRTNCFIGKNSYPVGANASIDEFSIHSTSLTQSQIDSLYNVNQCTFISNDAAADHANISLYPNPTNDRISVAATDANILKVEIRSLTGALLATSHSAEVSIAHLAAGLYLVHITTDKGVATQRISKY